MPRPPASSPEVAKRMRRQRRRDTRPEIALRQQLHRMGLRFRVDRPVLRQARRRADVVFGPAKVAVFIDGCYWHLCPQHSTLPRANAAWWIEKLERNVLRDRDTDASLEAAGWRVVRVWEHEDMSAAARRIKDLIQASRTGESAGTGP